MNPTITLGDVISIATFAIGAFIAYTRLVERLVRMETKVEDLWERRHQARTE